MARGPKTGVRRMLDGDLFMWASGLMPTAQPLSKEDAKGPFEYTRSPDFAHAIGATLAAAAAGERIGGWLRTDTLSIKPGTSRWKGRSQARGWINGANRRNEKYKKSFSGGIKPGRIRGISQPIFDPTCRPHRAELEDRACIVSLFTFQYAVSAHALALSTVGR